jgi:hypothetical protein
MPQAESKPNWIFERGENLEGSTRSEISEDHLGRVIWSAVHDSNVRQKDASAILQAIRIFFVKDKRPKY